MALFTVTNPPGTVTVSTFMDGRVHRIDLSAKATSMTETNLADEIVVIAGLATKDARSAQYTFMLEGMRQQGHDDVATRDFLARDLDLPSPEEAAATRARSSPPDTRVTMTDQLAGLFGSAVGMLPSSPARSLELFTEITNAGRDRLRRMGRTDPVRRHRPGDAVPRLVLANELRSAGQAPPRSR